MIDIKEVHDQILQQVNKPIHGYIDPVQIDRAINRSQKVEFRDLTGNVSQLQPGLPAVAKAYGMTQSINNELDPFMVVGLQLNDSDFSAINDPGTGPSGLVALPLGAKFLLSLSPVAGGLIDLLSVDKARARIGGPNHRGGTNKFVATYAGIGGTYNTVDITDRIKIQLFPQRPGTLTVDYLRYPNDVEYVFTQNGRVITYDAGSSSHLEWEDNAAQRIIERAISYLSEHLDSDKQVVYHDQKTVTGQ